MKKIAIIIGALPVPATQGGAVENLVQTILDENEKNKKFIFSVFTYGNSEAENQAKKYNFSNFHFFNPNTFRWRLGVLLRGILNKLLPVYLGNQFISEVVYTIKKLSPFDAIIIENAPKYSIICKKKLSPTPIITHLHNSFFGKGVLYEKSIAKTTTAFFCVSNYICKKVLTSRFVCANSVFCLHNGIDTLAFSRKLEADERARIRASLGIAKNDFLFIFSGRTVPEKGIRELVQAFEIVRRCNSDAKLKLLIVGASGFAGSAVETFATATDENIVFSGFIDYNEMWKYLNLGDVAVLPSIWEEPFCLALTEAMCCGLPIIATDSGGMLEIATSESALIVPRGDALSERLAEAMIELYKSPARIESMSKSAQKRGLTFSKARYFTHLGELLNKVTSKNRREEK